MRLAFHAILFLLVATFSACGNDGPTEPDPPPFLVPVPTRITLTPAAVTFTSIGETMRIEAVVVDQHGEIMEGAAVAWTSDNPNVATVDSRGLVTSVANGKTRVTARAGDVSYAVDVTVAHSDLGAEGQALVVLYYATGGPGWKDSGNWLSDRPLGEWHGISTDSAGRVTEVFLEGNRLTGTIPSELGNLENLRGLHLSLNQLSGDIPPELGQLRNLHELRLFGNQLSGDIPPELGQLRNLKWMYLGGNRLTGALPGLGQLRNLVYLGLEHNYLTGGIPSELGLLRDLVYVRLDGNDLTGGIPSELGQLQDLRELYLNFNQLGGGIPREIGQLQNLLVLHLNENQLTGEIPSELGQLRRLRELNLSLNQLSGGIPRELGQLGNLAHLNLDMNRLSGGIPSEIGQLRYLTHLYLDNNQLTGEIPSELGQLQHLEHLVLSFNRLTGNVPPSLGGLARLKTLALHGNGEMDGTLPLELAGPALEALILWGTRLCAPMDAGFQEWLRAIPNKSLGTCVPASAGSAAYLTQATQSLTNPVPLVAGEPALLRVFLSTEHGLDVPMPPVSATFYLDGTAVHTASVEGREAFIPRRIDEGDLAASANALVPGSVIAPGLEMVIEIGSDDGSESAADIPDRLPANGRTPVDVANLPPFDLTLVPFLWTEAPDHSVLAQTQGLSAESDLFRLLRDILPVRELLLDVREPVWTSVDPTFENLGRVINETEAIRTLDGATGHYMGILLDGGGIAVTGGFVSAAGLEQITIAHELGHNMNLDHAPCGTMGSPLADFPYEDGSIGAWGYDLLENALVPPDTPDLMGYCDPPTWISDYHFRKALSYRLSREAVRPAAARVRGLLIWGGASTEGELILEPAFAVDAPPALPRVEGPYRLTGESEDGRTLFSLSFGMPEIADSEAGSFAFVLPVPTNWSGRLARVVLTGPGGAVEVSGDGSRAAALLLDPVDGKIRGLLRDWPSADATALGARRLVPEPGLEISISRGVPALTSWER